MTNGNKKAGRPPGKSGTKDQIIAVAQTLFAKTSYDTTTIREIARLANVDPALVMHYFRTKQELFIAAMAPSQNIPQKIVKELKGDTETLGLRLATLFIGMLESRTTNHIIVNGLRAVIQIPGAIALLKLMLVQPILKSFKNAEKLDNAELRATLVQSQLIGLVITRYILKIEPLASLPKQDLITYLAPTLQRYLTGDLEMKEAESSTQKKL
jgi:AcrR family transcriptional regulator